LTTNHLIATNPFSTCRVRPGAIPFFFQPGDSAARLIDRLAANGWWGEIVGPHGSGKSTLLATLIGELERAGRRTIVHQLHDRKRRLPLGWQATLRPASTAVLVIDGFEKFGHWRRSWIKWCCRQAGSGLVVTTHKTVGLPNLFQTCVTRELARRVVEHLLNGKPHLVLAEEADARLGSFQFDLREVLFDLFDLHERRQRGRD
jgi:hypothetical protein